MGNNIQIRISKVRIESECESECCISFRKRKRKKESFNTLSILEQSKVLSLDES